MITQQRTAKDYLVLMVKGMAMGAADVVPGVSGGTIAFITGIYSELLHSLKNLGPNALLIWHKQGIAAAWRHINGNFLVALFSGILISLLSLAHLIGKALELYPVLIWAFFSGLILASLYYLVKQQRGWRWRDAIGVAVGAAIVIVISVATPAQLPGYWWIMFGGGFVAICAMILPGISGSFLLLLVGLYPVFLAALTDFDLLALASFGAGCICGLLAFSRMLSWLLDTYYQATLAVLMGFLVGSLNVTWPWKHTVEFVTDRHGKVLPLVQENVLPHSFTGLTGGDSMLIPALLAAAGGFFLVLVTEFISGKTGYSRSDS